MTQHPRFLPWLMWFFPLMFFGFQFILRLFPGLVMPELLAKYQISATDFGFFASLYYIGYATMQIPLAFLLDKFGARTIISLSAILCGIATYLFVLFSSWQIALISRFLIGVGSVVGFLGVSKVISEWFASEKYTRLVGLTFSFGLLGALYGGRPVSMMIEKMGWENVSLLLGTAALGIGFIILLFLRDKPNEQPKKYKVLPLLKALLSHRTILILAFANFLMVGTLEGFADVWGVSYLMTARGLAKVDAAGITSFIFVGMLFGGPLLAYFAEKYRAHFTVTMLCGLLMALLLMGILLTPPSLLPVWGLMLIMFVLGLLCCYQVIVFAIGTSLVPPFLTSIAVAFLNSINMLGGSFFHTFIGKLMDCFEQTTAENGVINYSLESYTYTLFLIPIASLVGTLLVAWSKKSQQSSPLSQTVH